MAKRDQRQEIMQAAEQLFTNRRFHEVTLDEVAQLAKVGKGTIYRHFSDKDDLFFQTATSGFGELCDLLEQTIPEKADFKDRLSAVCGEIARFFYKRRQLFRMMQMEEGRLIWNHCTHWEHWLARRRRLIEIITKVLSQGAEEGRVRKDVPAETLATLLLGMLRTGNRYLTEDGNHDETLALILSLFLEGAAGGGCRQYPVDGKRR